MAGDRRELEMTGNMPGAAPSRGGSTSTGPEMDVIALDINDLVTQMNQQLDRRIGEARDEFPIIPRVREQTRAIRGREYTPHDMPIGPYHWASSSPRMKDEKLACLCTVVLCASLRRIGDHRGVVVVRELQREHQRGVVSELLKEQRGLVSELLREMENLEARRCYTDRLDDGIEIGKEFVLMLLLDGCYLLMCFARERYLGSNNNGAPQAPALVPQQDGRLTTGGTAATTDSAIANNEDGVVRDTFYLLENQIPFVAVQKIYELTSGDTDPSSAELLRMFEARAQEQLQGLLYISKKKRPLLTPEQTPYHLLHLVRTYFKLTNRPKENGTTASTGRWHRATEYCSYANVQFDQRDFDDDEEQSVLDVSLQDGKLLVPRLRVDNKTWTILRNLMALEEHQASRELGRDVTAYCLFMSQVACTAEDVALLAKRGVVEHFLGSDAEAAAGFADLCKGVVLNINEIDSNYLKPTWHELERRYRSRRHNLEAWFRQTHCRNLWYAAAFAVAVILFASEVLQGIYAVIGDGK